MRAAPAIAVIAAAGIGALLFWPRRAAASPAPAADLGSSLLVDVLTVAGPRGIRNHNPGNIRHGASRWVGMADVQTDADFVQFVAPEYGIRALAVLLDNYRRGGRNTIRKIITRYAPDNENDTVAYVGHVARLTGIDADQSLTDADVPALITAIIRHENGVQPYDLALIEKGVYLA